MMRHAESIPRNVHKGYYNNRSGIALASFSKLCDFSGPTSKRHISDYDHRRNAKLGLTELYCYTE